MNQNESAVQKRLTTTPPTREEKLLNKMKISTTRNFHYFIEPFLIRGGIQHIAILLN